MPGGGNIAGGEDPGRAGFEELINQDPVAHVEPSLGGQSDAWLGSDAYHRQVGLQPGAVGRHDALDSRPTLEGGNPLVRDQFDAVFGVQVAVDGADFGPAYSRWTGQLNHGTHLKRRSRLCDQQLMKWAFDRWSYEDAREPAGRDPGDIASSGHAR